MAEAVDGELEDLLAYLDEARGFDFTGYKRASLSRRIRKRMNDVGAPDIRSYRDFLEAQPGEFVELFNTILINVTGFMRDADAWHQVTRTVLPEILDRKGEEDAIRFWSAGCSTGEEAYSLAIALCDAIGDEHFRRCAKIYGTDADEDALVQARQARYPLDSVTSALRPEQIERYFEPNDEGLVFRSDLRRSVIFGRHDLVQDPPISRIDLLVCRNTLMYFNAATQRRIFGNFHFALNAGGSLFLGKSEALVTRTNLFEESDLKRRIFRKDGRHARPQHTPPPEPAALAALTSTENLLEASFGPVPSPSSSSTGTACSFRRTGTPGASSASAAVSSGIRSATWKSRTGPSSCVR